MVIEHDFIPEAKDEEEPEDLFEAADRQSVSDTENVVQLFDSVTYFMFNGGGKKEAKKPNRIRHVLQGIDASKNVIFADITKDLPRLQKAVEAKIATEKDQTVKSLFDGYYAGVDTDIQDVKKTARFINDFLAVPEVKDS